MFRNMEGATLLELMSFSSPDLTIRPMVYEDIEEVFKIDLEVQYEPWSVGIFLDTLRYSGNFSWVLCKGFQIIGYLCGWIVSDELQILNIAIRPDHRRQGFARKLISFVINEARKKGVRLANLEVRESNVPAIELYKSLGFKIIGERPGYYRTPSGREKALLMELKF